MGQIYDKCWVPGTPVTENGNPIQAFVRNQFSSEESVHIEYFNHEVKTVALKKLTVNYAYDAHVHRFGPTLDFIYDKSLPASFEKVQRIFRLYTALPVHTWLTYFYLTFRVCQVMHDFSLLRQTFLGGLRKQIRDIDPIIAQKINDRLAYFGNKCNNKNVDIKTCAETFLFLFLSKYRKDFTSDLVAGAYPGIGRVISPGFGPGFGFHLDISDYCLKKHDDRVHMQAMVLYQVFCKISDIYYHQAFVATYFYIVGSVEQFYREWQKPLMPS